MIKTLLVVPFQWILVCICISLFYQDAQAAAYPSSHKIEFVADISLLDGDGKSLYLGRRLSTYSLLLPYKLVDEGFVLGVKGNDFEYYALPDERLHTLQLGGVLPTPLPHYHIKPVDLIFGFSFWLLCIALFIFLLQSIIRKNIKQRRHYRANFSVERMGKLVASYSKSWALSRGHFLLSPFSLAFIYFGIAALDFEMVALGTFLLLPILYWLADHYLYKINLYERGVTVSYPMVQQLLYFDFDLKIWNHQFLNVNSNRKAYFGSASELIFESNSNRIVIPNTIINIEQLHGVSKSIQTDSLLGHFEGKYYLEGTLDFSSVKIRKDQILFRSKMIKARDIERLNIGAEYSDAFLSIWRKGEKKEWLKLAISEISNFYVLNDILFHFFNPATRDKHIFSKTNETVTALPHRTDLLAPKTDSDHIAESFFSAINAQRKTEPLIGAKLGGKEILTRLLHALQNEKGVQIESLLTALGALAGFACQMRARSQIHLSPPPNSAEFIKIGGEDGKTYFIGEAINRPLAEGHYSVWSLACGAAESAGASRNEMPDIKEMFEYVIKTMGTDQFGIPRFPTGHQPGDSPINYVQNLWPIFQPLAERFCATPAEWPIMFGAALQEAITMAKDTLPPYTAVKIAMESAIPMSKIDPRDIGLT